MHKERSTGDLVREAENYTCPVQKASFFLNAFLKDLMCGRCLPCALGSYEAALILKDMQSGNPEQNDMGTLHRIAEAMMVGSRCKRGRDTAQFLIEMLRADFFAEHLRGRCPDRECLPLIEYRVMPERCTMCGECQAACRYHAVIGEKRVPFLSGFLPFVIASRRCTRCGECRIVCPENAIAVVDVSAMPSANQLEFTVGESRRNRR